MVDAFATVSDLQTALGRTFDDLVQVQQVTWLLEAASTYLREQLHQQIYPQSSATFNDWPDCGQIVLPMTPVISVDAVTDRAGNPVRYNEYRGDGRLTGLPDRRVTITVTYGYAAAPESLKNYTVILAAQALVTLELNLGLTAGGLSSVAIDDFKAAFADAGAGTGMTLPDTILDSLRAIYNGAAVIFA